MNKNCRKFGRKNFGKLKKSICIGNIIGIVKVGKETWQDSVIRQIRQSIFTANVVYCQCFYCKVVFLFIHQFLTKIACLLIYMQFLTHSIVRLFLATWMSHMPGFLKSMTLLVSMYVNIYSCEMKLY